MARLIYGTDRPRGAELKSWLFEGRMSENQRQRLGREDRPPCFDSEKQWLAWCILEAARPVAHSSYCYDCTACYAKAMQAVNRCEHVLTKFKAVGQPSILVGYRVRHRAPPRK